MRFAPRRVRFTKHLLLGLLILPAPLFAQEKAAQPAATTETKESDQPQEFRFEFGLFAGAHFFDKLNGLGRAIGDPEGLSPKNAVAFGGRLALNFNRYVSVEGEALAIPTKTRDAVAKMWAFGYRGSLNIHLIGSGPVRPFISVGYGAISTIVNNVPDAVIPPSDTDGLLHAGLGFKIALGPYVGLRLEGRVLAPPAVIGDNIPVGDETGFEGGPDYEALGGLYVNFGEIERNTIFKREVVNVLPPPSPDPDGDGIVGNNDKCPNEAEDKDGFEDSDGCPEPDNDKDGIADPQDKCPMKAETVNGIDDDDGCPEEDTDGDGIIGSRDKCPDEPETKNGFKDEDGCPDEIPSNLKKFTGVIEGINFKTASDKILPGSYSILDRAVAVLKEYADIRLEISGHTDSRGKSDYNRDLSQRRADSVKMYFIANGIDAARLTTIGYGMDRPIADNKTESGRSKNRRTEFRLMLADEGKPTGDSGPPPAMKGDSGPPPPMKP
jgi:OmpA-OmpF porin, OOP family